MAKVSIYVSDEMKRQMDELGNQVNWSQIAQLNFAHAISTQTAIRNRDMTSVVERLRASRNTYEQQHTAGGFKDGREWAELRAEYDELRSFGDIEDSLDNFGSGYEALHAAVGEEGMPEHHTIDMWFGGEKVTSEYVRGFIQGAAEVWKEVKDQL